MYDHDQQVLMSKVLLKAIEDYVFLAHPTARKTNSLETYWYTAIDFLFDPNYELALNNILIEPLDLEEIMKLSSGTDKVSIPALHKHVAKETVEHWDKNYAQKKFPSNLVIEGLVFLVAIWDKPSKIDFEKLELYIQNKENNVEMHEELIKQTIWTLGKVLEANDLLTPSNLHKGIARIIRMNPDLC